MYSASTIQANRRSDKITPKGKTPTYSAIWKRVNKLHIKMNQNISKDIVIAIDSTGVRVADRGG